jgi:cytochrome b subunit of formate dehydrogenase
VQLNYVLDAVIALAFIIAALSGVAFLLVGSGGYQGGRNLSFQTEFLGISRWAWSDLHTWAGLVMIAGVAVHFLLHWNWIVCVTKRLLRLDRVPQEKMCPTA